MAKYYALMLLERMLLPGSLLLSIALRPYGLSVIYLLLYLIAPLVQIPDAQTFSGFRGRFLLLITVISSCLLALHVAWHSVLAGFTPYGSLLADYPVVKLVGDNLGLVSYNGIEPLMAVQFLAPEIVMTLSSLLLYLAVKRLVAGVEDPTELGNSKFQRYPTLASAGKYLALFLIMFSGIMRPSVTSGFYFLVFMGAATAWSLGKPLERGFAVVQRIVMAFMGVHMLGLLAYQCTVLMEWYPPEMDFARYFGLTRLVVITDGHFSYDAADAAHWATMASPLVILVTYFFLGIESRELFKPKERTKSALTGLETGMNGSLSRGMSFRKGTKDKWKAATKRVRVAFDYISSKAPRGSNSETTPLMRRLSFRNSVGARLQQDSLGSIVVPDEESVVEKGKPSLKDDILAAVVDFFQVLIRSSYIATTVTMMAWSIMFHSWLTFVFLMWGNLVWLCHNQRSFMLKTSPVLVVYAMFLLLAQYIYGMNLTEEELPSNITSVNLRQIGFSRPASEACIPLLIKSLFTCMFWVTLRQRIQEIRGRRQSTIAADIAAPLQLTMSTAASVMEQQREEEQRSRLLTAFGKWLRALCARYWIYVVVIMLFVIGITGERMTIFRIIYMFLFLSFILMFQLSWYWWRRLMYMFWITVIIYSMINLILIYIYQFDNFSKTIETYLYINERLQHDLGLDTYHPADLFVKLLTPTLFLIMTIMQVHYFHADFMKLSDPRKLGRSSRSDGKGGSSRPSQGASTIQNDITALPLEEEVRPGSRGAQSDRSTERDMSSRQLENENNEKRDSVPKLDRTRSNAPTLTENPSVTFRELAFRAFTRGREQLYKLVDKVFIYLELHLIKIIFISLMLLSVVNVCAMHVPIMLVISPACLLTTSKQRKLIHLISTLISVYLMAKMVYQIDYIKHSFFDVNCTRYDENNTLNVSSYNNADWVGFTKSSRNKPLIVLLKGYIAMIALFTFHSLVTYRQQTIRAKGLIPHNKDKVMFPDISRVEADKDLIHCIKYLFNYGFYKFGVEITLMCLMGVIGSRMDVYAAIYAIWLLVLVTLSRVKQNRVWGAFTVYITLIIPIQYLISVGFLPQFCITYPWSGESEQMKHLRTWLYLPYPDAPPHASKLIFDYFLLIFASRQFRVFRIERSVGDNFPGGSNREDIGKDWETPEFVNPVPDFLGYIGTWLDVIKRMVFLGMLWVTLAIMFLTGTNRVNLFSMGYLVGSFIFLWQGTDFYLRPKHTILLWWSWLLQYNVTVVVVKAFLQIPGCIFSSVMQQHACWLVQLLGIGCVDKFAGGNISHFIRMKYVKQATCSVPQEDIGLAWDGVCFAFLILQRRLFHSYYFYRVIDESKATTVLASRGAELIEELRQKQMTLQEDQEVKILEKIKVKMERIKANQKKIQGALAKDPIHHDRGSGSETESESVRRRAFAKRAQGRPTYAPPSSHQKAVRSGDYYMFEEFDDTDGMLKGEESSSDDEDAPKEMGLGKLLSTAIKTDLKHAVSLRRRSMPAIPSTSGSRPLGSPRPSPGPHSYSYDLRRPSRDSRAPSGGKDHDESILDDFTSQPEQETVPDRLRRYLETAWACVCSVLVSLTRHVMRYSRDYRYISRTLALEKKILKESEGFGIGLREGAQQVWEPLPETIVMQQTRKLSDISVPEIRILAPSMEGGLDNTPLSARRSPAALGPASTASPSDLSCEDEDGTSEHESMFSLQSSESKDLSTLEDQDDSLFRQEKSPVVHLAYALWYAIIAHTDIVCYIMVFINQIQSATILSIPLPLMVFLWGTLTIPRPTKTFWVTLIAYTEVIVLIKSMFQFEILPWNQKVIPSNMPFTAPRIIGIERKTNYALYDLLLLLIIFLHRFMLKSLGLWKESAPETEVHGDMEYRLTADDTQLLVRGQGALVGRKYMQQTDRTGPAKHLDDESNKSTKSTHSQGEENPGPSKPPEDDHYKVNDDEEPIIAVVTTFENTYNHYPQVIMLSVKRYLSPVRVFFRRMLAPGARVTADVYAYMFLCDFTNFLVVIFGFAAFGTHQGDGGVQAYLEENKVPIPFLVMLILQFALIVIDRALYLRKFILGKILFQYALVIGVHIWMFFVLPFITERTFNSLYPPPMWYMMKCVYLLLSAQQIRCGYPRRIIGNFLCKSYRFLNMLLFRCFMAVPFVFELRTLMDWIWTDTSMTLMDWLKMEDIFASVFLLKCGRYMEDEFPAPRGAKKSTTSKYLLGGTVLAFVIAIIWFPLVFFAFGNTVGEPNPPTDVTVKIRIGPFLPVYQMSAQAHNIDVFTEAEYSQLSNLYARDRTAQTFLSNYMFNDVAVVSINPNSTSKWEISPPELDRLEREAVSNATISVKFSYIITHPSNSANNPPTIEDSREVPMEAYIDGEPNPEREKLLKMLSGQASDDTWLNIKKLFPKFLKVFNKGTAKPLYQLSVASPGGDADNRYYRDVQLRLERDRAATYWRVRELCDTQDPLLSIPLNNCDMLVMYTFNDKLFPETLNFISGGGIIGLYTTFVFLASRVLRGFFSGIYSKIMFDDLPNVDRVLQLCLDIYLVREAMEMTLEEDLFAKLVFLYRSPETMIKWSRPKEEESNEEPRAIRPPPQ